MVKLVAEPCRGTGRVLWNKMRVTADSAHLYCPNISPQEELHSRTTVQLVLTNLFTVTRHI
jgi:hypothetical protein